MSRVIELLCSRRVPHAAVLALMSIGFAGCSADMSTRLSNNSFSNPFASAKNLFFELLDLTCVRIANRANCENQYRKNQDWMIDRTAQQPTTKADFGLDHVSQLN